MSGSAMYGCDMKLHSQSAILDPIGSRQHKEGKFRSIRAVIRIIFLAFGSIYAYFLSMSSTG